MLVLQCVSGRSWRLIYKIDQRWVKNNRDPDNTVYVVSFPLTLHCILLRGANGEALSSFGAAAKEHKKLFYNDAGFLLAMAIADDAVFGYESLEDVQAQELPSGQDELVLRFKDSALERPIFRKVHKDRRRDRRFHAQKFVHRHLQEHSDQCRLSLWPVNSRGPAATQQGR